VRKPSDNEGIGMDVRDREEHAPPIDFAELLPRPSRRSLGVFAFAAATVPLGREEDAYAAKSNHLPKGFLTPGEIGTLDALAERIIPTDEHSPGAHDAGCAATIDRFLGDLMPRFADQQKERMGWRKGLSDVESAAKATFKKGFATLSPQEQDSLLQQWSDAAEAKTGTPLATFFRTLKRKVAWAYYTSEVGIHKDIGYLGNSYAQDFDGNVVQEPLSESFAKRGIKVP
jgi:hypothetical protein